jgi:hypothetical protein
MSGYICLKRTGHKEVDEILNAIESAGDCWHHTSQWSEEGYDGKSSMDRINEKIEAAKRVLITPSEAE